MRPGLLLVFLTACASSAAAPKEERPQSLPQPTAATATTAGSSEPAPSGPDAYVARADRDFASADSAHLSLAEQEYREAVRSPPPGNHVYGYAWYKLAFVYWNRGDGAQALYALKHVIDWSATYPQEPGAAKLRAAALHDVVPIFAQYGNPQRAYPFFRTLAGEHAHALVMLDELAKTYAAAGKSAEATSVQREIAARTSP